jgi:hypothetical protein
LILPWGSDKSPVNTFLGTAVWPEKEAHSPRAEQKRQALPVQPPAIPDNSEAQQQLMPVSVPVSSSVASPALGVSVAVLRSQSITTSKGEPPQVVSPPSRCSIL